MSLNPAENNVNGRPAIPGGPSATFVTIPYYITVHLGLPDDEAENIAVPFVDYIKNVASSELYPTWPENAIRANIHAIVSIALNRVFTQWYRTKGYNFDITNSTSYDMAYVKGRGVYDSISKIADEIFNDYIIKDQKKGEINPFFAQFCDGRISQCNGMYQWGSVDLANQGYSPEEILKYYYGDIGIVKNVPVGSESQLTYSGEPEKLGDSSIFVLIHQLSLNRVARNFPAIPAIDTVNGYFDESTENAVKEFQRIFKLPVTGIIDKATHYKLVYVYLAVSKVSEISAERSTLGEVLERTKYALLQGDVRPRVSALQYMLNILSTYNSTIPEVQITGTFDPHTRAAVIEFQKTLGLPATGIVDEKTWDTMYNSILGIVETVPAESLYLPYIRPHGIEYRLGMGTKYPGVLLIQEMLAFISQSEPKVPHIAVNGIFDEVTEIAVKAFQITFGLVPTGIVDDRTWELLSNIYSQKRHGTETTLSIPEPK